MQDQRSDSRSVSDMQDEVEWAVLSRVLAYHPAQLTAEEIARELGDPPAAIEESLDALRGAGLLHPHGLFVLPTRAAVRFDELYT